jgi:hypothetical protein
VANRYFFNEDSRNYNFVCDFTPYIKTFGHDEGLLEVWGGPRFFSRLPFGVGKFRESRFRESRSPYSRLMIFSL